MGSFSTFSPACGVATISLFSYSNRWVDVSSMILTSFHMLIYHLHKLFRDITVQVFCLCSNWNVCSVFYCWVLRVLGIFLDSDPFSHTFCKYFLPMSSLFFFLVTESSAQIFDFDEVHFIRFSFMDLVYSIKSSIKSPRFSSIWFFPKGIISLKIRLWFILS